MPGKRTASHLAAVTGASAGIGQAFARALARDGWNLLLVARRRRRLEKLAHELREQHGVEVEILSADLTRLARLRAVETLLEQSQRLELLVNNAGIGDFHPFHESDREREDAEIRLNVLAAVRLAHAALPGMVRRGRGAVINVSSTAGFAPCPRFATYGGTKAFLNSFTEALHEELRGTGVQVQALCPGLTHTEIFERAAVDASGLPEFFWMEPDDVVAESLAGLARGDVICVPGLANRALSTITRALPHAASSRIASLFSDRWLPEE
jgi:short-subunit dehydrogenase